MDSLSRVCQFRTAAGNSKIFIGTNTPKKSNLIFRDLQVKNIPLLLLTVDHSQLTNNSQPPEAEEFLFWISLKPISRGNR
ncbi:hypothetical protein VF14_35595 [Nostoc linckia z18]|uniref:Uncharacterized protein n=2 Tax=Nostoc linckia TaxID=92942 RepID=A0A9Q5Z4D1_NOSLI|nr:hypothetical protein VF02_32985 [Nostoc linckia z1]PHJ61240.1 hypothetical protein VF03_32395 [Nostoc linckia z2]PHJ66846.1 hypothetical protein VF05_18455 [Nostoc linckia z3]PHJ77576.1 hypothetical protein VF06_29795 [Nostoc linckia z4]PHJ79358.1 hypothetical protein VF07_33945 [Nostoc linckia z6]PHJ91866.1 hypothetical protein VF08_36790 [Nostoc linckia z8]PHJ92995.1 hypothetical protein VF04_27485 [Nostoc linckia z7]PHK07541.1 hypothetical protein VF09_23705 [Nostoc linckia z9]PHK1016